MTVISQQAEVAPGLFVGAVVMMRRPTTPPGWLRCDGDAVAISLFPHLYEALQTAYDADRVARGLTVPVGHFSLPRLNTDDAYVRTAKGSTAAGDPATSGLATHSHSLTTNVGISAVSGGAHSHAVPAQTIASSGDHSHNYDAGTTGGSAAVKNDARSTNYSGNSFTIYQNAVGGHTHSWPAGSTGNTGANHYHDTNVGTMNTSGAHVHTVASVTQSSHTTTFSNDPPHHPVIYYIKAHA
jgi:microcystin-dependent protein